jgi:hypothetical protein
MPGSIPTTGTEVSMGRIAAALGINPNATTQTRLNADLGVGRNRSLSNVASFASGSHTPESQGFGGLNTPNTY